MSEATATATVTETATATASAPQVHPLLLAYRLLFTSEAPATTLSSLADNLDEQTRASMLSKLRDENAHHFLIMRIKQIPTYVDLLWTTFTAFHGVDSRTLPSTDVRMRMMTARLYESVETTTTTYEQRENIRIAKEKIGKCLDAFAAIRNRSIYRDAASGIPFEVISELSRGDMQREHANVAAHITTILSYILTQLHEIR